MNYQDKNINALLENQKMLMTRVQGLEMKTIALQNNMAILQNEMHNLKQLIGHTQGRGNGPTVIE